MKLLPLYAILVAALAPVAASAQTIYLDSFARGTPAKPVTLDGTSPDVVNLPGTSWTQDGNRGNDFVTNGTSLQVSGGGDNKECNLGFSLANLPAGASSTSGMLTLSATVTSHNVGG